MYADNSYLKRLFGFHCAYKSIQDDINLTKNVVNIIMLFEKGNTFQLGIQIANMLLHMYSNITN